MNELITAEMLKEWQACDDGFANFCELFPNGADLQTAMDGLIACGRDDWSYWLFCRCRDNNLFNEIVKNGYRNSGSRNSGDENSGGWNSGDQNSGFFNSITPTEILIFNRLCSREEWLNADKPSFLFFDIAYWVSEDEMTDEEKKADPNFYVRGGQLRKRDYKEAFKLSWNNADAEDRIKVKNLPNFDAEVFFEISGIDLR